MIEFEMLDYREHRHRIKSCILKGKLEVLTDVPLPNCNALQIHGGALAFLVDPDFYVEFGVREKIRIGTASDVEERTLPEAMRNELVGNVRPSRGKVLFDHPETAGPVSIVHESLPCPETRNVFLTREKFDVLLAYGFRPGIRDSLWHVITTGPHGTANPGGWPHAIVLRAKEFEKIPFSPSSVKLEKAIPSWHRLPP